MDEILTAQELAKYLKLSIVTVYKYINEGIIPAVKVGSRWRSNKEQVDKIFKGKKQKKRQ